LTTLDFSQQHGGYFPPHDTHQRGVDADMRYIRKDSRPDPVTVSSTDYSSERTQRLIDLFNQVAFNLGLSWNVRILAGDQSLTGASYDPSGVHHNHLHLSIPDPNK
jgi:hypothetical protein